MGLGNNISMGQARGKNKAIVAKRSREYDTAKSYTAILSTAGQGCSACGVTLGSNV